MFYKIYIHIESGISRICRRASEILSGTVRGALVPGFVAGHLAAELGHESGECQRFLRAKIRQP